MKLLSIDAGQPIEPLSLALFTEALQPALESVERHLHFELTSQIDCDGKGCEVVVQVLAYAPARLQHLSAHALRGKCSKGRRGLSETPNCTVVGMASPAVQT